MNGLRKFLLKLGNLGLLLATMLNFFLRLVVLQRSDALIAFAKLFLEFISCRFKLVAELNGLRKLLLKLGNLGLLLATLLGLLLRFVALQ